VMQEIYINYILVLSIFVSLSLFLNVLHDKCLFKEQVVSIESARAIVSVVPLSKGCSQLLASNNFI